MTPPPPKPAPGKGGSPSTRGKPVAKTGRQPGAKPRPKAGATTAPAAAAPSPASRSTLGIAGLVIAVVAVVGIAVLFVLPRLSGGGAGASMPSAGAPSLAGCPTTQPPALPAGETRTVTIKTDLGDMALKISADLSPIAAGNFVALAECGWYDNVVFHRVVPTFVIQGGDGQYGKAPDINPQLVGTGGPPYTIQDEPVTTPYHRGTVAMARTSQPNSVGSQFFIVLDDAAQPALASANTYQIIGEVSSGMDVADKITDAAGGVENPPNPVVMNDVSVATP